MNRNLLTFWLCLLICMPINMIQAARLNEITDDLERQQVGMATNHTLRWQSPSGIDQPTDTIIITFANAFDLSNINLGDIDFSHGAVTGNEVMEGLAAVPTNGIWGVTVIGNIITLQAPTNAVVGEVLAGSYLVVAIGEQAVGGVNKIINPVIAGSYKNTINGTFGDEGSNSIYISNNDQVTVSALVPNNNGNNNNNNPGGGGAIWVEQDVKPPTIYRQIRPTYRSLYLIQGGKEKVNDVFINNSNEGVEYPNELEWESLRALIIGDNIFYLYAKDRRTGSKSQIVQATFVRRMIGDTDGDMDVDDFDLAGLGGHWLWDWWQGDFNEDGIVNDFDLAGLASHWTG